MKIAAYDPALAEAATAGPGDQEISAIARIADEDALPAGIRVVSRFGDVVTLRVRRDRVAELAESDSIVALEAARRLRLLDPMQVDGRSAEPAASSSYVIRPPDVSATGKGVAICLLDFGLDVAHPAFRNEDGTTRVLAIWDQRAASETGEGNRWGYGRILTRDDINRALEHDDPYAALGYDPSDADMISRESGEPEGAHGTHTTAISCGNGRGAGMSGVAPDADILFVHLARTNKAVGKGNLSDSATILEAIEFAFAQAGELACVLNMSVGAHSGAHDGKALFDDALTHVLSSPHGPSRAFVCSAGNYQLAAAHADGRLQTGETKLIRFDVPADDPTESELDVYYSDRDRFTATVIGPSGDAVAKAGPGESAPLLVDSRAVGHLYHYTRQTTASDHHIEIFWNKGAPGGRWGLQLYADAVRDGRYHAWIERDQGPRPRFIDEDVSLTTTTGTLCNSALAITVGAFNPHLEHRPVADFSSSGPTRSGLIKPEILAPGVGIVAARSASRSEPPGAYFVSKDGTSMASPHVAGAIACMLQSAARPMRIADIRAVLLSSTSCHTSATAGDLHRRGYGYLDIAAAEKAAHKWSQALEEQRDASADVDASPGLLAERSLRSDEQGRATLRPVCQGGELLSVQVHPGDVLVRAMPHGDPYSAVVKSAKPEVAAELAARGIRVESAGRGWYVEVVEPGRPAGACGRRLTDSAGRMVRGQMLLRAS